MYRIRGYKIAIALAVVVAMLLVTLYEAQRHSVGGFSIRNITLPYPHLLTQNEERANATILVLVRNSELKGMLDSMRSLERSWNHQFHYPWMFVNDEAFTPDFMAKTQAATESLCSYETIPAHHWEVPAHIDKVVMDASFERMTSEGVRYARSLSYRQMCRWYSGSFYKLPALQQYRYYWRVEPGVEFFCMIDYDVFKFMQQHNKTYGFTIAVREKPASIETLWPVTLDFASANPEMIAEDNAMPFLLHNSSSKGNDTVGNTYNTCHFWSNFEIGDMDFWRSEAYEAYFAHLDHAGGFFYERWGDAPVHTIGAALLQSADRIHYFHDIGYHHPPYRNCPDSSNCAGCVPGQFSDVSPHLDGANCKPFWLEHFPTATAQPG